MKLINESFFNRRNWILEHLEELDLSMEQALCMLCIDFFNEFHRVVDIPSLSKKLKMDDEMVDTMLNDLMMKGYLEVKMSERRIYYSIDGLFRLDEDAAPCDNNAYQNLFQCYEKEFARPLSQKECEMLSEWIATYDMKLIEYALREAVIYDKKSFAYIDRILLNWKERGFTAKMYEEK